MTAGDHSKHWDELLYGEDEWLASSRPGTPPIYQTSNFVFRTVHDMRQALKMEDEMPFYTRGANPTLSHVAKKLAALEGMESGLLFASGSAAIAAAVLSQVAAGDKIVSIESPYSWTKKLIQDFCGKYGVDSVFCGADELETSICERTRVIYLESPNSWTFKTQDLKSITQLARAKGITTILDNSYSTPLVQQGGALGVDLVAHSATKYLGGHSDVVAGVLCGSSALIQAVFNGPYMTLGAVLSPFDAWLLLRSLHTLPVRLQAIRSTTTEVISFLQQHPKVREVHFPGRNNPEETKDDQKTGLLSLDLATEDQAAVERFCNALRMFKLGPSWGSHESLAFPAIATLGSMNYNNPAAVTGRVRLSIGLQSASTLTQDLGNALDVL